MSTQACALFYTRSTPFSDSTKSTRVYLFRSRSLANTKRVLRGCILLLQTLHRLWSRHERRGGLDVTFTDTEARHAANFTIVQVQRKAQAAIREVAFELDGRGGGGDEDVVHVGSRTMGVGRAWHEEVFDGLSIQGAWGGPSESLVRYQRVRRALLDELDELEEKLNEGGIRGRVEGR